MNAVRTTSLTLLAISSVVIAQPVFAQITQIQSGLNVAAGTNYNQANPDRQLPIMIGEIIGILLQTVGILLLGYLIYAGFQWMTAGGDESKVKAATMTIRNVIIGLIIIVAANAIAGYVVGQLASISSGGTGTAEECRTIGPDGTSLVPC